MSRESDLAEVDRLAQEAGRLRNQWRALASQIAEAEHRYYTGRMDPLECGRWVDERPRLAREKLEVEARADGALVAYWKARDAFYATYVQPEALRDPSRCKSVLPFTSGVGFR